MKRLIEKMVFSGFVTAWRLATWPTSRSPDLVNATTEGVSRLPSGFVMTTGSPPSMTATTEFVVPRSIPMILLMFVRPRWCPARHNPAGDCYFLRSALLSNLSASQSSTGPRPRSYTLNVVEDNLEEIPEATPASSGGRTVIRVARRAVFIMLFVAAAALGSLGGVLFAYGTDLPEISRLDD